MAHKKLTNFLGDDKSLRTRAENKFFDAEDDYGVTKDEINKILKKKEHKEELTLEEQADYDTFKSEVGANLIAGELGTEDFIDKIIRLDENAARKIIGKIKDMKAAIKSLESAESREKYRRLRRAEKLFLKAAEQAGNNKLVRFIQSDDDEEEEIDNEKKLQYNYKGRSSKTKNYKHISQGLYNELLFKVRKLYQGISDGIADGIAIEHGKVIYIVDSGKDNGTVKFGVREIISDIDDQKRNDYIKNINKESAEYGLGSREVFEKLGIKVDKYSASYVGRESGKNSSHSEGESGDNESGVSSDNGDRGVQVLGKKIQPSYAGDKSKTANHRLLAQAKKLEAQGVDSEEIRQKTGWFKGYDGKWRYEIDDSKMEFLGAEVDKETTLGEVIKHDKLFEAYPELREVRFILDSSLNDKGYYDYKNNLIKIPAYLVSDASSDIELKKLLIHEIQHAIQKIEGFAKGGSWKAYERELLKEKKLKIAAASTTSKFYLNKIEKKFGEYGVQVTNDYYDLIKHPDTEEDYFNDLKELEQELKEDGMFELVNKYIDAKLTMIGEAQSVSREAWELYQKTAGEIEAYDVGDRLNFTPEQRKTKRPDIDQKEVEFADEPHSNTVSEGVANKKINAGMSNNDIDIYTEEQYNNFGWARETDALTFNEVGALYSVIKEKRSLSDYPCSSRGEYIVEVNNKHHTTLDVNNVFVFFKGDKNNPQITRVIRAEIYSNTEMEEYRNVVYERERGDAAAVSIFQVYEAIGIFKEFRREYLSNYSGYLQAVRQRGSRQGLPQSSGANGSRSNGRGATQSNAGNANPYIKVVHTFTDISGAKRNVVKFQNEYNIEGNPYTKYMPTIEAVVEAENARVINRYAKKLDLTAGMIKNRLNKDPDYLNKVRKKFERHARNFNKKIQYSRKASTDGAVAKPTVNIPMLNRLQFKIYTKENAEQIISGIAFNTLNFNDGTQGVIKNKGELVDLMWRRLNSTDEGKRDGIIVY